MNVSASLDFRAAAIADSMTAPRESAYQLHCYAEGWPGIDRHLAFARREIFSAQSARIRLLSRIIVKSGAHPPVRRRCKVLSIGA